MKTESNFPARAIVTTLDGEAFVGSATEVVEQMRNDSRAPCADAAAFRAAFGERAFLWAKRPVRIDTDEAFLIDLAAIGFVSISVAP
jgi:hypothetical protein